MHALHLLAVFTQMLNIPTCYTFFNVSCVPEADKGVLREVWKYKDYSNLTTLQTLNNFILQGTPPSTIKIRTLNHFTVSNSFEVEGHRDRAYFLCHLTGEYEFYFSCDTSCKWSIKATEQPSTEIAGGASLQPMDKNTFNSIPANLTEAHAYHIEVLHFSNDSKGYYMLQIKGPDDDARHRMSQAQLVVYKNNGNYSTLHHGDWEAWSPCSVPCGPHVGRQVRNRSCATYPSMFNMTDGYDLTMSRACNVEELPCTQGCNDSLIVLTNNSVASFHMPFNSSQLLYNFTEDNYTVWCFNDSVASYLEINLTTPHRICAIQTKGVQTANNETKYMSSYLLEFSADGSEWKFYNETVNVTVFEGNIHDDPLRSQKNYLTDTKASLIRIWPVLSNGNCTRLRIYGQKGASSGSGSGSGSSFVINSWTLQVYNSSSTSLIVRWSVNTSEPIRGYQIKLTDRNGKTDVKTVSDQQVETVEVGGLYRYSKYCVTMTVIAETGYGRDFGAICAFTAIDVPSDPPENLTVQNSSSTSLLISWNHFRPYFAPGAVAGFELNITDAAKKLVNTFTVKDLPEEKNISHLTAYTEYCITLRAVTKTGHGDKSDEFCAFTDEDAPTMPPANISAIATSADTIFITWDNVPEQARRGIVRTYRIKVKSRDQLVKRVSVGDSQLRQYEITDLKENTTYCVQLYAKTVAKGPYSTCVNVTTLAKVNGGFTEWSNWDVCDASCGVGQQSRARTCTNPPPSGGGHDCIGEKDDSRHCNLQPCPVDGGFTEWSNWDMCNASCGVGQQSRTRTCTNPPPSGGGRQCIGDNADTRDCKIQLCPVDGGFTEWSNWDVCDASCDGGQQSRTRACTNPPPNSEGRNCSGARIMTRPCNLQSCFVQPPTKITANASASTSIKVSWHSVPLGQNGAVIGYRVMYIDKAETQPKLNVTVEADISYVELTDLLVYTNYCIQVLAFTSQGDGNISDCFVALTGEGVPSASPTDVTVQSTSSTSLAANWNPVPTGHENGVITGFKVLYVDAAESQAQLNLSVSSTNFSLKLTNLLVYTNYCIQVLAFTRAGDGVLSDCVVAATEEDVPSTVPTNPSASMDINSVSLSWDQAPAKGMNGELIGYAVLIQEFNITQYVAPCHLSFELNNVNFTADTCIQMAAVTRAGYGNLTDCITINLLDTNFTPLTATSTMGMSSSAIKVTLTHPTREIMGGKLLGYYIKYQAVRQGGEPIPDLQIQPADIRLICANYSKIVLTDLPPYVMYKIEVAPLTDRGLGNFSVPVYGETCRCKEYLSASIFPSLFDTTIAFNSLTNVLIDLVTSTCGHCDEHNDSTTKLKQTGENQTVEKAVTFPVTLTQAYGNTAYSKFIPVITVPGLVIVKRKAKDNSGLLTKVTANSVLDAWPVFVVTLVTALLAGIIIWILDSKSNEQHFPRTFFKGAGEGFWWSFISMSTVGYGDRCPQSIPAKIFAMAWFLVGLIMFCIFMGSLSAVLTVTVVKMGSSGSYSMADDGKVAVVANSPEHKMAVNKFRNKITIGSTFPNLTSMVQALKDGNISSVLLDMYITLKRTDLFNGSWFDVTDLLEGEIHHGVLLQGEGVNLAAQMKNLIIKDNIQTKFLQGNSDTQKSETEAKSVVFFEPSSPYYLNILIISAGLLLTAIICGLFYQAFCYKRFIRHTDNKDPCTCGEMKRDITKSVETFYRNFSNTCYRIRKRHKAQLITFMKKAKRA